MEEVWVVEGLYDGGREFITYLIDDARGGVGGIGAGPKM